ncbi:Hypothetical predicted protein [Lecanosticta acicola]|uniref:Uncharacterized protein n=1 Tax=Lecanosticta acicola TaxID=111012 RepID=A0AAI8W1Z7_9PEZI|nr:Hypothetical predicted protein [Lecanosticta acicola]
MGPAVAASDLRAPPPAIPSPATPHDSLETPALSACPQQQSPALQRPSFPFDDCAALVPPEPRHVAIAACPPTTPTPPADGPLLPEMNLMVGGALAPVHPNRSPVNHRSNTRPRPALRLPSFQALGIAAPHPDRFGGLPLDGGDDTALMAPLSDLIRLQEELDLGHTAHPSVPANLAPDCPSRKAGDTNSPRNPSRAVSTPFRHDVATLTPPAEIGDISWLPTATISNAPVDSRATDSVNAGTVDSHAAESAEGNAAHTPPGPVQLSNGPPGSSWIDKALAVLLRNLSTAALPANPLRVLSHALPSPSPYGHIFPHIIEAMHGATPSEPTVWINVFHAIQGRFNLADLPTSPPATPGPPIRGEDYFTQKVFDSAVPISDYQEDLSGLPRSPRPVVPPSSINVSIVERYIPPTSPHEFIDMFNPSGPSLLVDRLVELSPNNGSLVFIYPTRTGAQTFMRDYLGPILDPALRSIVVVNGLSSNLSMILGKMIAVDQMLEFEQMKRSVQTLCAKLTQRSSSMQRFHGSRATFSLAHASSEEVHLDRETWAKEWWSKQEKPRVREAVTRYTQEAQKRSSNENMDRAPSPTELIQQLLNFVAKREYPPGQEPTSGIELSVFVIQRSN